MPITTIRIKNDLPVPAALVGALVEFYNLAGVFQTSGTTESNGEVAVTLAVGSYDVFMRKAGVTFLPSQPQRIDVLVSPPNSNLFLVSCHERVAPETTDPLRCRVSGSVLGVGGGPFKSRSPRLESASMPAASVLLMWPG